jgi:hypothetical protein
MGATYSLNMMTEDELRIIISDCRKSLAELAPYNGSVPGARAIGEARHRMEAAQRELDGRSS